MPAAVKQEGAPLLMTTQHKALMKRKEFLLSLGKEFLLSLGKGGEQQHCPRELLPQDMADFKLRSQRKCTAKAEQHSRGEGDNTECARCVNGINKEFIQIDSLLNHT